MKKDKLVLFLVLLITVCFVSVNVEASKLNVNEAENLKSLGLFMGTDNGFELEKVATRAESAAMLVRLLGVEKEAKDNKYNHPFTDVPEWADQYIGYMYENGLTTGISKNKFGSSEIVDGKSYATFALRALGYDDSIGDFTWQDALEFANKIKLIDNNELKFIKDQEFKRNELVLLSYNSLQTKLKNMDKTLMEELIKKGAINPNIDNNDVVEKDSPITIPIIVKKTSQGLAFDMLYSEIVGLDIEDSYMIFRTSIKQEQLDKERLIKKIIVPKGGEKNLVYNKERYPKLYDPVLMNDLLNQIIDNTDSPNSIVIFYNEELYPTHYFIIPSIQEVGVHNMTVIPTDDELKESIEQYLNELESYIDSIQKKIELIPQEAITIVMDKSKRGDTNELVPYAKINRDLLPLSMKNFTDITTTGHSLPPAGPVSNDEIMSNLVSELKFVWDIYGGKFTSHNENIEGDKVRLNYKYLSIKLLSDNGELLGYTCIKNEI